MTVYGVSPKIDGSFGAKGWVFVWLAVAVLIARPARGDDLGFEIEPGDVHALVGQMSAEVAALQRALGATADQRPVPLVSEVEPFEVYLQARTLYEKADNLAFEHVRTSEPALLLPSGNLRPADVYAVVESAQGRLRAVMEELGVTFVAIPMRIAADTPTEVYKSMVRLHRQVSTLATRRLQPADVYRLVTQSLAYALQLRLRYPGAEPPESPAFEEGKQPGDVLERVLRCFRLVAEVAQSAGVSTLRLVEEANSEATPEDVYENASLVIAELRQIHALSGGPAPVQIPHPGVKTPSDVFQRVRMLEAILSELAALASRDPQRLRGGEGHG